MSGVDPAWIEGNNAYLAESLSWLRARLMACIPPAPAAATMAPPRQPAPPVRRAWYDVGQSRPRHAPPRSAVTTPPVTDDIAREEAAAAARRAAAAAIEPPPALLTLAERLGLTAFERDTVLLCAAAELEPSIATLFGTIDGQPTRGAPTFALALHVLSDPSWDAISPHRPLRYARLLEITQPAGTPLTVAALRVDERIVHYLKGLNALDERLAGLLTQAGDDEGPPLAPSQLVVADAILAQLRAAGAATQVPLVALIGNDVASKVDAARHVAGALGRRLYRLGLDAIPAAAADVDAIVRLNQRERLLVPIALFVDADELASATPEQTRAFHAFASRDIGLAFISLREPLGRGLDNALSFEIAKPTAREQHAAWAAALPEEEGAPARLAGHFDLGLRDIARATTLAAAAGGAPSEDEVWAVCRRLAQPRLDQLAERIEPRATWADIVLAPQADALLHEIADQARHRYQVYEEWGYAARMTRGLGIGVLFSGESGTGKTMAAEVLANEIKLSLYRIDLSAVVSKYIGETEKNLSRMFDAAEQGGAILLFDEADALFGKRSEVKDSHDRYANIEINYLLQRMEAFSGLAILATNMKSALDTAFLRRLRFVVSFPYPGPAERERIWRQALPDELPRDDLDFKRLSRFGLSGANIHSIALNASFMAASRQQPLNLGLVMAAVRTELKKLDKLANEAAFR